MTGRTRAGLAALAGLAIGWASGAGAQTTPVQPQPGAPNMPSPGSTPPEKIEPGVGGSLSEKLNASDGVIRPPAGVDSAMPVRPPVVEPNSTPVIVPPGEPGGNGNVRPK